MLRLRQFARRTSRGSCNGLFLLDRFWRRHQEVHTLHRVCCLLACVLTSDCSVFHVIQDFVPCPSTSRTRLGHHACVYSCAVCALPAVCIMCRRSFAVPVCMRAEGILRLRMHMNTYRLTGPRTTTLSTVCTIMVPSMRLYMYAWGPKGTPRCRMHIKYRLTGPRTTTLPGRKLLTGCMFSASCLDACE